MKYSTLFIPLLAAAAVLVMPAQSQAAHHLPDEIPISDTTALSTAAPLAGADAGDVVLTTWGYRRPYYNRYYHSFPRHRYYYPHRFGHRSYNRFYYNRPYSRFYHYPHRKHFYHRPHKGFSFRFGW